MKCKVTFDVNGELISLDLETGLDSPLTNQDIIQVLSKNEDQRKALCDLIHNRLYKSSTLTPISVKDLTSKEGLLGNCGIDFLKQEFPEITFPEGVDANVLLINNLRIGNQSIYGRTINSQGKELFIIRGSKGDNEDVKKLASFLKVRELIKEQSFRFDETSSYYSNLQEILQQIKKDKVSTIQDLLLDFMYDGSSYRKLYFSSNGQNVSVYSYLQEIVNVINNYGDRLRFEDQFVDTINTHRGYFKDGKSFLSLDSLYSAMEQYHPNVLEVLQLTSKTKFHNYFSKPSQEISDTLSKVFGKILDGEGYNTLISSLLEIEPDCTLSFSTSTSKGIYLKQDFRDIQTKYGISYDTISTFDIVNNDYKGYKIYAMSEGGETKYIPSRGFLVEDDMTRKYNTEKEAMNYIDSSVQKQDIKRYSLIDFKLRNKSEADGSILYDDELSSLQVYSRTSIPVGKIIESIDVPIVNTRIFNGEDILFKEDRQNYSSFKNIVNKWHISDSVKTHILEQINTPERIAMFVYKINERLEDNREGEKEIDQIVTEIESAGKKYYYIESRDWIPGRNTFKYKVIPTDPIVIDNYKKVKKIPVIRLMQAISETLRDKFNVEVNLHTSEQIKNMFPDVDCNTVKAFIRDGKIYVNTTIAKSTDLVHEYIHLVLGVLKTNQELRRNYEQLMYQVSRTDEGRELLKTLRETYNSLSEMDLMEEVFAKLFSGYVMRSYNPNVGRLFVAQDKFLKDASKIVFNTNIDNIQSFYGKSLETIFTRFSSDVSWLLDQDGLDFKSTSTGRRYSNWISDQIKKGEITEQCYG